MLSNEYKSSIYLFMLYSIDYFQRYFECKIPMTILVLNANKNSNRLLEVLELDLTLFFFYIEWFK